MRKTTERICSAFENRRTLKLANSETDGNTLWLFGNAIARWHENGLWITNAGWSSNTTKERLNGLSGVHIQQRKGTWFLNGREWAGEWVCVSDYEATGNTFEGTQVEYDTTIEWIDTGGYRGYDKPIYSVCGANDTGTWADSPCRTEVATRELGAVSEDLERFAIPHREMQTHSSNVFCTHRYLIVPPAFLERAKDIVKQHIESNTTELLYEC